MAAHNSRSLSIFLRESSASVNANSASSNPALDEKGDQSSSVLVVGGSGGTLGGTKLPCLSQRRPVKDQYEVV